MMEKDAVSEQCEGEDKEDKEKMRVWKQNWYIELRVFNSFGCNLCTSCLL